MRVFEAVLGLSNSTREIGLPENAELIHFETLTDTVRLLFESDRIGDMQSVTFHLITDQSDRLTGDLERVFEGCIQEKSFAVYRLREEAKKCIREDCDRPAEYKNTSCCNTCNGGLGTHYGICEKRGELAKAVEEGDQERSQLLDGELTALLSVQEIKVVAENRKFQPVQS